MVCKHQTIEGSPWALKMRTFSDCTFTVHPEAIRRQGISSPLEDRSAGFLTTPPPRPARNRAFTVVEMIGVLAIIAVLAAAIMPNVIRKIDRATLQRETTDLSAMGNGLIRTVLATKQIPAQSSLADAMRQY